MPTSPRAWDDWNASDLADCLQAIRCGDETAATRFVSAFEPEVRRFVRVRLTDPGLRRLMDSIDIVQSVMGRFFLHLQADRLQIEHPLQLLKLLLTMARNALIDHSRHAAVRRNVEGVGGDLSLAFVADRQAPQEDSLIGSDLLSYVRQRLGPQERALLDGWLGGTGWEELAGEFGSSPEALRKRMTRAIDRATSTLGLWKEDDGCTFPAATRPAS